MGHTKTKRGLPAREDLAAALAASGSSYCGVARALRLTTARASRALRHPSPWHGEHCKALALAVLGAGAEGWERWWPAADASTAAPYRWTPPPLPARVPAVAYRPEVRHE
jgi:hypothetical protein